MLRSTQTKEERERGTLQQPSVEVDDGREGELLAHAAFQVVRHLPHPRRGRHLLLLPSASAFLEQAYARRRHRGWKGCQTATHIGCSSCVLQ